MCIYTILYTILYTTYYFLYVYYIYMILNYTIQKYTMHGVFYTGARKRCGLPREGRSFAGASHTPRKTPPAMTALEHVYPPVN